MQPAPWIVIWETTRACDLACSHCRASAHSERHPDELSRAEGIAFIRHIREEFGRVLLVLTGGDPMKRQDIFHLIEAAHDCGLTVALAPSATPLLRRDDLMRAQDAGLHRISLSVDGINAVAHDRVRGISGTWKRTMELLDHAAIIGLDRQINTTITTDNFHQLHEFRDLAQWYREFVVSIHAGTDRSRRGSQCAFRC